MFRCEGTQKLIVVNFFSSFAPVSGIHCCVGILQWITLRAWQRNAESTDFCECVIIGQADTLNEFAPFLYKL